jgi:hypothetical protein
MQLNFENPIFPTFPTPAGTKTLKPYQGLKPVEEEFISLLHGCWSTKTLKPYQGLKLVDRYPGVNCFVTTTTL